jgi:hypothetical protein
MNSRMKISDSSKLAVTSIEAIEKTNEPARKINAVVTFRAGLNAAKRMIGTEMESISGFRRFSVKGWSLFSPAKKVRQKIR